MRRPRTPPKLSGTGPLTRESAKSSKKAGGTAVATRSCIAIDMRSQRRETMEAQTNSYVPEKMKTVYTITERGGRNFWTKIGVGFINRDGSITLKLDAIPVNGQVQVRDYEPYGDRRAAPSPELRGRAPRDEAPDPLA
jgi:hypothetical protein